MNEDNVGVEHLLAAIIIANGGEVTINAADLTSGQVAGKFIGLDLNPDNTITMRLVDFDDDNK